VMGVRKDVICALRSDMCSRIDGVTQSVMGYSEK
jgi:hypothetical protein